jgi:hypothetical protein
MPWSDEEQAILNAVLAEQSAEGGQDTASTLVLCCVAASRLGPTKGARDVAARLRVLRNQDPDMVGLAAAAAGARAAASGMAVPGASASAAGSSTGSSSSSSGGAPSWNDPTALLAGPVSVRATMALDGADSDGSSAACAAAPSFPFALPVAQLLQANQLVVERLRHHLLAVQLHRNPPLMAEFEQNTAAVFSMLSSLPCQLPPLPPSCRLNLPPRPRDSTSTSGSGSSTSSAVTLRLDPPPGAPGATHGLQAGVAFPLHPSSALAPPVGAHAPPRPTDATGLGVGSAAEARHVPVASPAHSLQALPLGQPNAPHL